MNINFLHRPDFHEGLLCHRWAPATRFHLCVRWQICLWKTYLSFNVSIHALSIFSSCQHCHYGPLTRYTKLRVAHGPGILGTCSPSQRVSDPDMHQGTCVSHVPWCMLGSLTSSFVWHWRGKWSRHSRRMHNPQFSERVHECEVSTSARTPERMTSGLNLTKNFRDWHLPAKIPNHLHSHIGSWRLTVSLDHT